MSHNGFRCGELHTFIAEKGGGKSTLIRTWIVECLKQGKKVFLRLSEDKSQTYRDSIAVYLGPENYDCLKNLYVDSEREISRTLKGPHYMEQLKNKIISKASDIFILDNFTTSELSRGKPENEAKNSVEFADIAADLNIPVIVVAHTEKGFNKKRGIASGDNIRGNMTLSNTAAYIYTLTIFHELPEKPSLFFIDKARHHSNANKKLFLLDFENGFYKSDRPATYEYLKVLLKDASK
jgi:hypothetical protein